MRKLDGPEGEEGGAGVLPYTGYIGMWGLKGYGQFSVVLVMNRVLLLADFGHFGHEYVLVFHSSLYTFKKKPLFHHYRKENQQRPFTNYVYSNLT